ncbi:hypothetical protein NMY22_g11304 [Coprinellus aureogranulatus]|nr:hypothetical protein NMY22_g11304 [Coprinellus aureogranulatus]
MVHVFRLQNGDCMLVKRDGLVCGPTDDIDVVLSEHTVNPRIWLVEAADEKKWDPWAFIQGLTKRILNAPDKFDWVQRMRTFANHPNIVFIDGGVDIQVFQLLNPRICRARYFDPTHLMGMPLKYEFKTSGTWVSVLHENVQRIGFTVEAFADRTIDVAVIPRIAGVTRRSYVDLAYARSLLGPDWKIECQFGQEFRMVGPLPDQKLSFRNGIQLIRVDLSSISLLSDAPSADVLSYFAGGRFNHELGLAHDNAIVGLSRFTRVGRFQDGETVKIINGDWYGFTAKVLLEASSILPNHEVKVSIEYGVMGGRVRVERNVAVAHIRKRLQRHDRVVSKSQPRDVVYISGFDVAEGHFIRIAELEVQVEALNHKLLIEKLKQQVTTLTLKVETLEELLEEKEEECSMHLAHLEKTLISKGKAEKTTKELRRSKYCRAHRQVFVYHLIDAILTVEHRF